jgi:thioester reductase-like protein
MLSGKMNRNAVKVWLDTLDNDIYRQIQEAGYNASMLDPSERVALQISYKLNDILDGEAADDVSGRNIVLMQRGLDSISAISLSNWIRKTYGVAIPLQTYLSSETSVRSLASLVGHDTVADPQQLVQQAPKVTAPTTGQMDLKAEFNKFDSKLAKLPISSQESTQPTQQPRSFLVTGSTGFLGSQIVRQLLERPDISKVVCLIRGDDDAHAKKRMLEAAHIGRWWKPAFEARLEVWRGDLSKPLLGLDASRWSRIGAGPGDENAIDAIIHNGAVVHWQAGYRDMSDANIGSTVDLLSTLSTAAVAPRFSYVAGGYFAAANETEEDILPQLRDADGYSQTKFLSQMLTTHHGDRVSRARPQVSLPSVIKPGLIVGDAQHGVSNVDDFLWRVVAASVRVGAYNGDEAGDANAWLQIAGSDQIAASIIDSCLHSSPANRSVRFVDGISVGEMWRMLRDERGYPLRPVSPAEWLRLLKEDMEREGKTHLLFPVFQYLEEKEGSLGIRRPTDGAPVYPQEETQLRIQKSIEYLEGIGYLGSTGPTANGTAAMPAFRRSGLMLKKTSSS